MTEAEAPAPRQPLDERLAAMLAKLARYPDPSTLSVEEVRKSYKWRQPEGLRIDAIASTKEVVMPGEPDIPLRVYTPLGTGPFPVLLFIHGSGFVACDLDTHDAMCRNLCAEARCLVVAVDYRLAPEHKFPAAIDDCLAAARWVSREAGGWNGDAGRMAIFGDSAGGNLATVTALRIRDEGGPRLCAQVLAYPVIAHYSRSQNNSSYIENAKGYGLSPETMRWFWDHYLADQAQAETPLASPMLADTLAGLPPAYIVTAGYDVLRDEGRAYADQLKAAGVPVTWVEEKALHHGFLFMPGVIGGASEALDQACAWLRQEFESTNNATGIQAR